MNLRVCITISMVILFSLSGCGNDQHFQRFDDYEAPPMVNMNYPIKAIERTNTQVDILWVIDNSGSMSTIQQNVISNTSIFLQEFDKKGGIDWKMGLLSTDQDERPYLGLNSRAGFNSRSPNRVSTFVSAVSSLGINGSYTEKTFTPVMNRLNSKNQFIRKNAMLVIISVTDVREQSQASSPEFIEFLTNLKGGDISKAKFYGVYSAKDFGCRGEDSYWTYSSSKYEQVVVATGGSVFAACAADFGTKLTSMAKEIISYLQNSKIMLKKLPKTETIKIFYKGVPLPGGLQSNGGMWYYDVEDNAIVFYNLDFAPGSQEDIQISFDEDDGY
jgi:hypothetical protein